MSEYYTHPTAEVSTDARIGPGAKIWHQAQIREGAHLGANCIVGKGAYIDFGVQIGENCKLQNGAYVYHGSILEDGVFLGPGVMLLNDKVPRAINTDGSLRTDDEWAVSAVFVGYGAAVGGGSVLTPGITVGRWALVGSGAVVTRNIPDYGIAYGNPARLVGYISPLSGERLDSPPEIPAGTLRCPTRTAADRIAPAPHTARGQAS